MKTLDVHQFIAWLQGISESAAPEAAEYRRIASKVIAAQKFNFGDYDQVPLLDWLKVGEFMAHCPEIFRLPFPNVLFFFEGENAGFVHIEPIEEGIFRARHWWFNNASVALAAGPWAAHIDTTGPEHRFKAVGFLGDETMDVGAGDEEEKDSFSWTALFAYSCLAVLNAVNVETEERTFKPSTLAKHRRKGKLPLYSYKTLCIRPGRKADDDQEARPAADARRGPRVHLRRGHLRRLEGKVVWVQPCVVGNREAGMIGKQYRVRR